MREIVDRVRSWQAEGEYVAVATIVCLLLLAATAVARARIQPQQPGDSGYLALARTLAPPLVAERGDGEQPVDFERCRQPECARSGRPVLYVHAVRRAGFLYLEYWEYLPIYTQWRTDGPSRVG